ELNQYPRLHNKLLEVVSDLLRERLTPTSDYVESLIAIQRAYINTNHPDFIGGGGAISDLVKRNERRRKDIEKNNRRANNALSISTHHPPSINGPASGNDPLDVLTISDGYKEASSSKDLAAQSNGTSTPVNNSASWSQREGFLTYFFGSGNKQERTALPDQPINRASKSSIDIGELERQLAGINMNGGYSEDSSLTEQEEMETQLIRSLITSYFHIVRKTIQDIVPKAIMHLLVNNSRESVQNRLVSELYKEDLFVDLLQEDESLASERQKCQTMLDVYKKAFEIINEAM
ncbi:438_t:CDS:2, partial [Ambispora gerdemannii]